MADVLLFHHAQGLTPGVRAFADELRAAGHTVHVPDLFDGRTFDSIDEGMAFVKGPGSTRSRARRPHRRRPARPSSSTPASRSARWSPSSSPRRGRAPAARCCSTRASRSAASGRSGRGRTACRSRSTAWTPTRSSSARETSMRPVRSSRPVDDAELFLYPGDQHYFADSSLPSYDPDGDRAAHAPGPRLSRPHLTSRVGSRSARHP